MLVSGRVTIDPNFQRDIQVILPPKKFTKFLVTFLLKGRRKDPPQKTRKFRKKKTQAAPWRPPFFEFGYLNLSNEKNLGWLGYIGDEILPSYKGSIS